MSNINLEWALRRLRTILEGPEESREGELAEWVKWHTAGHDEPPKVSWSALRGDPVDELGRYGEYGPVIGVELVVAGIVVRFELDSMR